MKNLDAEKLAALATRVIPSIQHDYSAVEMLELMAQLPELASYDLQEDRIPYDDLYYSDHEMLVPDFEKTIKRLHESLD